MAVAQTLTGINHDKGRSKSVRFGYTSRIKMNHFSLSIQQNMNHSAFYHVDWNVGSK